MASAAPSEHSARLTTSGLNSSHYSQYTAPYWPGSPSIPIPIVIPLSVILPVEYTHNAIPVYITARNTTKSHCPSSYPFTPPSTPFAKHRGVVPQNLSTLAKEPQAHNKLTTVKMSLYNTRSLTLKTRFLKDLLIDHNLDFLFLTETWLQMGESEALVTICPEDYSFFSSPRSSGRTGGGLATVVKNNFKCHPINIDHYPSFEVQVIKVDSVNPLLIALIYRPPKYHKDFIDQFASFLTSTITNFDQALILGDINIHVCCPTKPLVNDFMHLIESFNLTLLKTGPTHRLGHTLDLVLSLGLNVNTTELIAPCLSDHSTILFNAILPQPPAKPQRPIHRSRHINASTANKFSEALIAAPSTCIIETPPQSISTDELTALFNSTCATILDTIAPFKTSKPKPKGDPWLNDTTRALRRECRKAERRWKKDKLQISFEMLKNTRLQYQESINKARITYFSNLISNNSHNPQILFKTINSVIHPPPSTIMDLSTANCIDFQNFFYQQGKQHQKHHAPRYTNYQ